jgi:hypothetical protein
MITMETYQLRQILTDAAELGAQRALAKAGITSATVSKSEAYALYGRRTVDMWIEQRQVKPRKTGKRYRLEIAELEAAGKAEKRTI